MSIIRFGDRRIKLPGSRIVRVAIGVLLVLGGILGFLPVLGFWMIPLGLLVLSIDLPPVRRLRRRLQVRWEKRRRNGATAREKPGEGDNRQATAPRKNRAP